MKVGDQTFKVHLDGYNLTDALAGKSPSPRKEFFYFNDDGSLVGLRYNQYKIVFAEQRAHGLDVWQDLYDQGPMVIAHETCENFEPIVIASQEAPRCNFNPNKTRA